MTEHQLHELLNEMTLTEKVGQLVQLTGDFFNEASEITGPMQQANLINEEIDNAGSVIGVIGAAEVKKIQDQYLAKNRLKIPLIFMNDIIHGTYTIFPVPIALASSFNPELIENIAKYSAKEAYLQGSNVTFSPMADLACDARWGRNMESSGEDTFLSSKLTESYVKGYQQKTAEGNYKYISCVKHFAGYGSVQSGREYSTVDISKRFLSEYHYPSYQAAIDAGAEMVMSAFNTINSVPAVANKELLREQLRKKMNFNGVIISDWGAVQELINHQVAQTDEEAALKAFEATCDIDMMSPCYPKNLEKIVNQNPDYLKLLDESVYRILMLKNKLGLFENPYPYLDAQKAEDFSSSAEIQNLAKTASDQSQVLLKNNNKFLPLNSDEKILILGELSDTKALMGPWSLYGTEEKNITIKDYFLQNNPNIKYEDHHSILNNIEALKGYDKIIYFGGETQFESGEAKSKVNINVSQNQIEILKKLKELSKSVLFVNFSGRPLNLTDVNLYCDAIIQAWFLGSQTSQSLYDIIFGKVSPSGKLAMSFPRDVGQCPITYKEFQTGRPQNKAIDSYVSKYIDEENQPLFSFGHGLTYCDISIANINYNNIEMNEDEQITIDITLENNSDIECHEIIQLYINDLVADVIRPLKELKGFKRIFVPAKQKVKAQMQISKEMLTYIDHNDSIRLDSGEFEILIGLNSQELHSQIITLK